jgi:hypothetical protein
MTILAGQAAFVHVEQGSPEWFQARLGIPTASCFAQVLAKGEGKTRKTYMMKLADEAVSGEPMESFTNGHTERGNEMEDEARLFYAFMHSCQPYRVGFVRHDGVRAGCSPDSLIGDDGLLEIKTKLPHLLAECRLSGKFPAEHKAQCQGALWITGRKWIDLAIYWPKRPLFVIRAERDEDYIAKLAEEVSNFNYELEQVITKLRACGGGKD